MKIQLDDKYILNSDACCYWITTLIEPKEKDGKKPKPYEKRVSGYTRTFTEAVISYIESKTRQSEATEISELADEVERLKEQVSKWKMKYENQNIKNK